MKFDRLICVLFSIFIFMIFYMEAEAVRPPLKPLSIAEFREMISNADMIAMGTITVATQSKTFQPPLQTVLIHASMKPERILKGDKQLGRIEIEETYQQYPVNNDKPDCSHTTQESVTAQIAGPAPQVGRYRIGDKILVLLKSINGTKQYSPLGSGDYDTYFGVFRITAEGVTSDKYQFDPTLDNYSKSQADFLNFITSITGEQR